MRSSEILDVISIAKTFGTTPAQVLGIDESEVYLSYCVNEACTYIYSRMQPDKDGKVNRPQFDNEKKSKSANPGLDFLMGL